MEFEKCLSQLDEILKYLNKEELEKIPYEIRKNIKEKKDKQYVWKYDETKKLEEQDINRKTIAMLSYLNIEYLLDEEQKLLMEKIHRFNEEKIEQEKAKKYSSNNIFKESINKDMQNDNNVKMIIKKEDKWYKKIIDAIVRVFNKDNK